MTREEMQAALDRLYRFKRKKSLAEVAEERAQTIGRN